MVMLFYLHCRGAREGRDEVLVVLRPHVLDLAVCQASVYRLEQRLHSAISGGEKCETGGFDLIALRMKLQ